MNQLHWTTEPGRPDTAPPRLMPPPRVGVLTPREIGVLTLVAEGLSNRSLAQSLHVSEATVRAHMRSINLKLDVHSRMQAVATARRHGLIG
ncbi:MAG: response regulator transcription factor [Burkholderiales bacterium]